MVFSQDDLLSAMEAVKAVPETRNPSSVFSNIIIRPLGLDRAEVRACSYASNLSIVVQARAEDGDEPVAVQFSTLLAQVRAGDNAPWFMSRRPNNWATFRQGHFTYDCPGIMVDCMPDRSHQETVVVGRIWSEFLLAKLLEVAPAMSRDEGRPNLNGIHLSRENDRTLRLVATDGYVLLTATEAAEVDAAFPEAGIILHRAGVESLIAALKSGAIGDVLEVEVGQHSVVFRCGDTSIDVRRIELEYPQWRRVVPSSGTAFEVARKSFCKALSSAKGEKIGIAVNGHVELRASNPERGESRIVVDGWKLRKEDPDASASFNAAKIKQVVKSFDAASLILSLSAPGFAMSVQDEDGGLLGLVMPVAA
jgi:DNA polymerase III sliding clamp (beta) subunit (PCNA family)